MPRHHFLLSPAAQPPATVRVWFDLYWGRLHWVARWHTASGARAWRGSFITSVPSHFLGLLRGLVEEEVRASVPAQAVTAPARLLDAHRPPVAPLVPWTIKRTLAHPPMPAAAPHGAWCRRSSLPSGPGVKGRPEVRP
ncbi:hypothetical protein [uncultured Aquincola sp.]|uniref:hypothetical protein n=1 Tax=uncultured Aquincola sp. TaxID=886556 RepID=UPI0032B0F89A|tara:strand:+ start:1018 stop:1431 length:414 start_codon:yes stop_codon:yes gene_type:complete